LRAVKVYALDARAAELSRKEGAQVRCRGVDGDVDEEGGARTVDRGNLWCVSAEVEVVRRVLRECSNRWHFETQNDVVRNLPPYGIARCHGCMQTGCARRLDCSHRKRHDFDLRWICESLW